MKKYYARPLRTFTNAAILAWVALGGAGSFSSHAQSLVPRWSTSAFASTSNRGMAYNPATDHLLLALGGSTGGSIKIIKAQDGTAASPATLVYPTAAMNLDGVGGTTIPSGTHYIAGVAVGSDGVIYGCNYGSGGTRYILKWTSESANPTVLYSGAHLSGLTGSIGANLAVYGTGENAVFVMSSTQTSGTTAGMIVYHDGTGWVGKVLSVPNGSIVSGLSFIDYDVVAPNTYRLIAKTAGANGAVLTFDPTLPSPITAGSTTMSGVFGGYSLYGPHNNSYDPATGLIGAVTRVNNTTAGGNAATNLLVNTGMKFGSGTLTAPVEIDREQFIAGGTDAGSAGGVAWGNGALFISASALGTTLFAYDVTAFLVNAPADLTVAPGTSATFTAGFGGSSLTYVWKKGDTVLTDGTKYSGTSTASLTIHEVEASDADTYTVSVTGVESSTASASAGLTVSGSTLIMASAGTGTVKGLANTQYTVQYSNELSPADWQTLTTVMTDGSGNGNFSDGAPSATQRFYRLLQN